VEFWWVELAANSSVMEGVAGVDVDPRVTVHHGRGDV